MKPAYFHKTLFAGLMLLSTARPAHALDNFYNPSECTDQENQIINCFVDTAKEMGATVERAGVKDLSPTRAPFTKLDKTSHRHVYILMSDGETFAAAYLNPHNKYLSVAVGHYSRDKEDFLKPYTILTVKKGTNGFGIPTTRIFEKSDKGSPLDQEAAKQRTAIARGIAREFSTCTK
jgi:hypothetical protein